VQPLRVLQADPAGLGTALLSAPAAADILAILRAAPRPDGVAAAADTAPVAYKTGTSFGFRDAWAFGVTDSVTVGVWMGRADGTPRPGAFARETAAPLMFKLLGLLPAEQRTARAAASLLPDPTPHALSHLAARDGAPLLGGERPRIVYPPPDVLMKLSPGSQLSLEASGGHPPYIWSVNGTPLAGTGASRTASWQPDGPGYVHLTLTDRTGASTQQYLELQ